MKLHNSGLAFNALLSLIDKEQQLHAQLCANSSPEIIRRYLWVVRHANRMLDRIDADRITCEQSVALEDKLSVNKQS